jgi:RNA-directed DNA polymerase
MTVPNETQPSTVSATAKQDGDVLCRWAWTERAVWTERMLTALEQGVKGGVWFSLIDKVYSEANLLAAYNQVAANEGAPGVDHITTEEFGHDLVRNLKKLAEQIRDDTYVPHDIRRVWIPKPGTNAQRPLGIPTVRDRVAQAALLNTIEPIFEREFSEHSYGFRPGLGCKDGLREVDALLKDGHHFVVDADLKSYFDTIPHEALMACIRERISDGRILSLIESFLKAGILSELGREESWMGAPQGAVISPLLSNIYLHPLDQLMTREGMRIVRYADDFVILCRSREEAERALQLVQEWTASAGLSLHPTKTRLVDVREEEFTFLGYSFSTSKDGHIRRWPGKKSLTKFKETIRTKTGRNRGDSLKRIIVDLNESTRGWFGYFKHSYATTFPYLDGLIRRRLRNLLRKRQGGHGIGTGQSNRRWPNRYFTERGLFSLKTAYQLARQSPLG